MDGNTSFQCAAARSSEQSMPFLPSDAMFEEQETRLLELEGRLTAALMRVATQEQRCQLLTDSIERLETASASRASRMQAVSMELKRLLTERPQDIVELRRACDEHRACLSSIELRMDGLDQRGNSWQQIQERLVEASQEVAPCIDALRIYDGRIAAVEVQGLSTSATLSALQGEWHELSGRLKKGTSPACDRRVLGSVLRDVDQLRDRARSCEDLLREHSTAIATLFEHAPHATTNRRQMMQSRQTPKVVLPIPDEELVDAFVSNLDELIPRSMTVARALSWEMSCRA